MSDTPKFEPEIHYRAADGLAYQKAIAGLRPAEVSSRIRAIHEHIQALDEKVIGREGVHHLTEIDFLFRAFYTGRDRADFQ